MQTPLRKGLEHESLVWLFHSSEANQVFPSGVWASKEMAEEWIQRVGATGTLSAYVLDESAYDSNIRLGYFKPKREEHSTNEFKEVFTTAVEHAHYSSGATR